MCYLFSDGTCKGKTKIKDEKEKKTCLPKRNKGNYSHVVKPRSDLVEALRIQAASRRRGSQVKRGESSPLWIQERKQPYLCAGLSV